MISWWHAKGHHQHQSARANVKLIQVGNVECAGTDVDLSLWACLCRVWEGLVRHRPAAGIVWFSLPFVAMRPRAALARKSAGRPFSASRNLEVSIADGYSRVNDSIRGNAPASSSCGSHRGHAQAMSAACRSSRHSVRPVCVTRLWQLVADSAKRGSAPSLGRLLTQVPG